MQDHPTIPATALPLVAPPRGVKFWLGTWSGRILLINAAVFLYTCLRTRSLFLPDTETLLGIGAKDPVGLAKGEYWRLVTPMFIHIGVLHFAVNSYMLYVIGYQLERILGGAWYLAVYLAAGIAGNVASAVFSVNLSAGASGAIFGLLGAGFFLERTIGKRMLEVTGQRPRNRAYAMTVAINLAFGFLVPFIDNSAHLGGLVTGTLMTLAMINIRPNNLQVPRRGAGFAILALLVVAAGVGTYFGTSKDYLYRRAEAAADRAEDQEERIYHYTQAIEIMPDDAVLRLKRARLLFFANEAQYAFHDLRVVVEQGKLKDELEALALELEKKNKVQEAWQIRRLAAHGRDGF